MSEETNEEELVEYDGRRIYPEVAKYFMGQKEAERNYCRASREIQYDFDKARQELLWEAADAGAALTRYGDNAFSVRHRELDSERARRAAEALEVQKAHGKELLNSPHKEVRFIAERCLFADQDSEVVGHAHTILKHLPATTDEIWRVAKDEAGMCEVFDQFYQLAEEAGVFQKEGEDPFPGLRHLAAMRSYVRREFGEGYAHRITVHVDRGLKAVHADYTRRLEAAKAEWQGMDEAYAENTHRNRSEGARRAAETRRRNMIAERAAEVLENAGPNASVASVGEGTGELQIPTQSGQLMEFEIR